MLNNYVIEFFYVLSAFLFILGVRFLGKPKTARLGNLVSGAGMALAVLVTLFSKDLLPFDILLLSLFIGIAVGLFSAIRVQMTAMPELVALFNGSGGVASLLVGYLALYSDISSSLAVSAVLLAVFIGAITISGSIMAYLKLSEKISGQSVTFPGQLFFNALLILAIFVSAYCFTLEPSTDHWGVYAIFGLALILGVMIVLPIGGADMPVVISILNSYSGLAACVAGFAIANNLLIVAGALVGASGIILTGLMCKAMNRSLANVLFSAFMPAKKSQKIEGEVNPINTEDAFYILEAAQSVVFIPGYGMAIAQAQHVVRELADLLEKNGTEVFHAIHPVAGRMPGHMNVLLAEANVPYEYLYEMDDINPRMPYMDVAVVIGANDVVNPIAAQDEGSPIYGMPIIKAHEARTVFVLKRSMASGFSGESNPLFFNENTRMLFGDAKSSISSLVAEFKSMLQS